MGEAEVNLSEFVASGRKTRAYILQVGMCECAYVYIVYVRGACVWFGACDFLGIPSGSESRSVMDVSGALASAVCA